MMESFNDVLSEALRKDPRMSEFLARVGLTLTSADQSMLLKLSIHYAAAIAPELKDRLRAAMVDVMRQPERARHEA